MAGCRWDQTPSGSWQRGFGTMVLALSLVAACGDGIDSGFPSRPDAGAVPAAAAPDGEAATAGSGWIVALSDEFGASALADARLVMRHAGEDGGDRRLHGTRGTLGPLLADGAYRITLEALAVTGGSGRLIRLDPSRLQVVPEVLAASDVNGRPLELIVRRRKGGGQITVEVSGENGAPLAAARALVFQAAEGGGLEDAIADLRTSARGKATAANLLPGRYCVQLCDAGALAETKVVRPDSRKEQGDEFDLGVNGRHTVRFVVGAAGQLSGDVTGFDPATDGKLTLALRRLWEDGVWRPVDTPGSFLSGSAFSLGGLAPASYRVVVLAQKREARASTVQLEAGKAAHLTVDAGPENPLHVGLEYGAEEGTGQESFNLNRVDDLVAQDVAMGTLVPGDTTTLDILCAPRPGQYLLILWSRRMAMQCEVTTDPSQVIRVVPPKAQPTDGPRTLRVRVEGKSGPIQRLLVALRRVGDVGPWMRFEETWPMAQFGSLADGGYDILVYDGIFGVAAGFEMQPMQKRVEIRGRDEDVVIRPFGR